MAKKAKIGTEPVFTVTLDKGVAERNRLPLGDVIRFLGDLKSLVIETGREIERSRGITDPSGDYGLEVLADGSGSFLAKGSVKARIAITRNIEIGAAAVSAVMSTVQSINSQRRKPATHENAIRATVMSRLDKMAYINIRDKVDTKFSFSAPTALQMPVGTRPPARALINNKTIERIREYNPTPVFVEENVTLFGKLFHLKDKSKELQEESTGFWGELKLDSGERWRIQFSKGLEADTAPLFRHQVCITGTAHYFEKRGPKLVAKTVAEDTQRDYEAAFDELLGSVPDLLAGKTLHQLLEE